MRHPRFAAVLLVFLLGAACSGEEPNRASEQQLHVESFIRAYNDHRVEKALVLFGEDASVSFGDDELLVGRAALRGRLEWDSVLKATLELDGVTVAGDTIRIRRVVERSDALAVLGLDEVIRRETELVLDPGGEIQSAVFGGLERESGQRLDSALGDFLPWAQHDFPQRLQRIRPDGFDYRARRARDWLSLLTEWRKGVR